MTPVATTPPPSTRRMTASEFFDWVHRPENRNRFFELDRGEVVEMPPPGKYHGFVCGNVAWILGDFARQRRKGYVCTNDAGVLVERDPDTVRGPDVTFYEDAQTIDDMDRQYAARPPLLAVEVLSPNDRINRTIRRITQMLHGGVARGLAGGPRRPRCQRLSAGTGPAAARGSAGTERRSGPARLPLSRRRLLRRAGGVAR